MLVDKILYEATKLSPNPWEFNKAMLPFGFSSSTMPLWSYANRGCKLSLGQQESYNFIMSHLKNADHYEVIGALLRRSNMEGDRNSWDRNIKFASQRPTLDSDIPTDLLSLTPELASLLGDKYDALTYYYNYRGTAASKRWGQAAKAVESIPLSISPTKAVILSKFRSDLINGPTGCFETLVAGEISKKYPDLKYTIEDNSLHINKDGLYFSVSPVVTSHILPRILDTEDAELINYTKDAVKNREASNWIRIPWGILGFSNLLKDIDEDTIDRICDDVYSKIVSGEASHINSNSSTRWKFMQRNIGSSVTAVSFFNKHFVKI